MKRIVTDDPQDNTEVMMNLAFVKDKEVWIRGGGIDGEDCTLVDFSKQLCMKNHECQFDDGFPSDIAKDDFDQICDLFMECSMCGCPIGTMYFVAIQAAELREKLRKYEEQEEKQFTNMDRHYKHLNDLFLSNAPDERTARENWDFQIGIAEGLKYAMQSVLEQEGHTPNPKVLTLEELESLPRMSIVWIEYWDGELQGPGKTLLAGMKCYDGTVVDEDASSYSDFQRDMTPDYDGSRWRFWLGKPTDEQRRAVPWE